MAFLGNATQRANFWVLPKFDYGTENDESNYARAMSDWCGFGLHEITITASDFIENIRKVIYHLDYPVAGPALFHSTWYPGWRRSIAKCSSADRGGDEIFGGIHPLSRLLF